MAGGGSAVIGALRVVLGADTAAFEDGLKGASSKLDSFGSSAGSKLNSFAAGVTKAAAVVSVAMVGAVTALGYAVSQSVDKIDNLGKAAQKAGAPIEEFSALASSAGKVKISVDELANGMEKLAKSVSSIAGGGKVTDAGRAFQALGISVKDAGGNLKSSSDIITEIAGKFESFQDGPAKTALAIAIFGKAGAEMIPLLNQGSEALKKQRAEMEELGLVIDQKTFKAAEQFNQSLTRLGKVKDSIIMKLTVGMLPALNDVSGALVKVSKDSDLLQTISEGLALVFKGSIQVGLELSLVVTRLGVELKALAGAAILVGQGIVETSQNIGKLAPSFDGASKDVGDLSSSSSQLASVLNDALSKALSRSSSSIDPLSMIVRGLAAAFDLVVPAVEKAQVVSGKFSQAGELMRKTGEETDQAFAALRARIEGMFDKPTADALTYSDWLKVVEANLEAVAAVKIAAPIIANSAAIDKFVDSTKKSIAAQDAETQTIGMAAGAKEKLRVVLQGLEVATANHIPITDALRAKLDALGLSAEQSALKLAGQQLAFANKEPLVLYQTELANTQTAMMAVGATAEQLARNQEAVAQRFGMSWQNIGANIASTAGALSQLTGTFAKENKAMGILSKTFAFGQIAINTAVAVTKALASLPPPASYVAVGLAIAAGAAQAAAVAAQGFAKGGSFMVPGGKSMTDNMMVPLNLASGERVDITPANDVGRAGRGGNTVIELHGDKFSRDNVRDLFETINSGLADGHKFKVA